jgi:uncharacterized membrane protein SirB2
MLYLALKYLHVTCVALSVGGFCLRGLLLLRRKSALAGRHPEWHGGRQWLRALPHINDSLLLAAAIGLAALLGQYPFIDAWLTAKIGGLLGYILLGALALRPSPYPRLRILAGCAAVAMFGWIVSVALAKHPAGFLV